MAKAEKLPSGSWRVRVYAGTDENGKKIKESITAPTKREAEELARKREDEIRRGKNSLSGSKDITVGEAIDNYIDFRDAVLSPKTILEYRNMRKNYCQDLMQYKVSALTENAVQKSINTLSKSHAPKTVRNFMGLLIPSIHAVDKTISFDINLPQKDKIEMKIPEDDVLLRIMDAAKGTELYIPVLLGSTCGLRRSEIAALDYVKDFDMEHNTVTINKAVVRNSDGCWEIKPPKTTAGNRTVTVPVWVMEEVKKAAEKGESPCNADYITNGYKRILRQLGISGIRFHDLRHYYASSLLALGVPDKYAMARMGHSTPDMLKNVYQHRMKEKDRELDTVIADHFNNLFPSQNEKKSNK